MTNDNPHWKYIDLDKFWNHVSKQSTGCWNWTGSKNKDGYGYFHIGKNKYLRANRLAWELSRKQSIPKGKMILHTCDNRLCINPTHLYCGSGSENNRDRSVRNPLNCGGGIKRSTYA